VLPAKLDQRLLLSFEPISQRRAAAAAGRNPNRVRPLFRPLLDPQVILYRDDMSGCRRMELRSHRAPAVATDRRMGIECRPRSSHKMFVIA